MLLRRFAPVRVGTIVVGVLLAACRSEPLATTQPAPPKPGGAAGPPASAPVAAPSPAQADALFATLAARPIYTFDEEQLGTYAALLHEREPDLAARIVRLARQNIGQPYEIFLLGEYPFELHDPDPIYCLARSDCLTFCEHTYALALARDWWSYLRGLQRLRYRDGVIGILTRNHFTEADWNRNNAFLLTDVTSTLGGGRAARPFRQTCRRANFFARFGLGQDIPDEELDDCFIPTAALPDVLAELADADFVNIMRGTPEAPFCGHTGLITHGPDSTVNFLHSARPTVREQPLLEYLATDQRSIGVKILRLRPDAQARLDAELARAGPATPLDAQQLAAALARLPRPLSNADSQEPRSWATAMHTQAYRLTYDTPVDRDLQAALAALDERIGAALGIPAEERAFGVLTLGDLRLALLRPDAMFYGASVPKICILLAYFDAHPEAAFNLDPTVRSELERMIKRSDNDLAAKYSQLVGLDALQKLLQSDQYAFYDRDHGGFWCGKHYGVAEPRVGDPVHDHSHAVTVRQCLRYYLMLEQGKLVSAAASATMQEIFAAPTLTHHNHAFVRGLNGRDVAILRKSGEWAEWHLDTARVQNGGQAYLLAGATRHARGEEYLAQMAAAVDELVCGPPRRLRERHATTRHETAEDFTRLPPGGATESTFALRFAPASHAAEYVSDVLESHFPCNEVVASWNIKTPPGTGFCFELRVAETAAGPWSPWLYLGAGGTPASAGPRVVECELGRVDVDYFRATQPLRCVQYRVRAVAADSPTQPVAIRRVVLCLSDRSGIPPALPVPSPSSATPPERWQRRLPVPFRNQITDRPELAGRICSAACLAMLLEFRGVHVPTLEIVDASHDPVHDLYGNWPRAIQAAYQFGVPGYLTRFAGWEEVEHMIAEDQPLIISIAGQIAGSPYGQTDGHLIVLTGFDAAGNATVNDPSVSTPELGCLSYSRADLEQAWLHATGGLAYVLLPREEE